MNEEVVTVPQAAVLLGVKVSAVRKAIARGSLKATTVKGRFSLYEYLIERQDVDHYRTSATVARRHGRVSPIREDRS